MKRVARFKNIKDFDSGLPDSKTLRWGGRVQRDLLSTAGRLWRCSEVPG